MQPDDGIAEGPTLLSSGQEGTGAGAERLGQGARAGEYEVERFVGAGAMGDVYAGRHPLIGKRVAIKVIKRHLAGSAEAVERFLREARAVNQVDHANVVDVFGVGRLDDGRLYLVMDLLEGEALGARLRRGPLEPAEALRVLDGIAAALDAAHARGVIHRDLKPDNVFLTDDRVVVLDFGIAKLLTSAAGGVPAGTLTDQGTWLGTPAYMAPEQWGADGAGPASDRYALGVIAFELLAGKPPFSASSLPGMMEQHFRAPVPTLSTLRERALPARIDEVLRRAMAKDPDARYPSGAALVDDLRAALGTAVGRRARPAAAADGPARRPVAAIALGVGTVAAAAITGALLLRGGDRDHRAADRTEERAAGSALEITSSPAGARVRVGGIDRGATPLALPVDDAPRTLTLVIDKPGYAPASRTVQVGAGAPPEPLRVTLAPVTLFEGMWALPDGALRRFERRGEQVAMFSLAAGSDEPRFERFFEFAPADAGLCVFVAAEEHVDPRNPDEPSCNLPLRAEYTYDPTEDALTRRQERVQLGFEDGHCTVLAKEWGPPARLRRLGHADGGAWAESTAGAGLVADAPLVPQVPFPDEAQQQAKDAPPQKNATVQQQAPLKKAPPRKRDAKAAALQEREQPQAAADRKDAAVQRQDELRRDLDARDQAASQQRNNDAQAVTPPPAPAQAAE